MKVVMLALLPGMLGWILSGALRSLGHARTPMVATSVTVVVESLAPTAWFSVSGPLPHWGWSAQRGRSSSPDVLKAALLGYQVFGPRRLAALLLSCPCRLRASPARCSP